MWVEMAQDVRLLQAVPLHEVLVRQQIYRGALRCDQASIEDDHPGAQLDHQLQVVCGDELRDGDRP